MKTRPSFRSIRAKLKDDLTAEYKAQAGTQSRRRVAITSTSFHLALLLRLREMTYLMPIIGWVVRSMVNTATTTHNCDIDHNACIGGGVRFPHPFGIVIGPVIIGTNVTIMHQVTLGGAQANATAVQQRIGNNVFIGAGAKIIGNVTIGDNAEIGANAVVLTDVPANSTAVGVPAKILKRKAVDV